LKKILLIIFSVNTLSCGEEEINPHVLDTQLAELREYRVIDKENLIIEYVAAHPLILGREGYGNSFWCFSPEDMAAMKDAALKCNDKKKAE